TASERAVVEYKPKVSGRLDDLTTSAEALLRQLPGVVQVDTSVSVARPSARIIHLRDWHYVPRDLYALDPEFTVCDPACGTGGFLVAASEWLLEQTKGADLE